MKSIKNTGLTVAPVHHNNPPGGSLPHHVWAAVAVTVVLGIVCCVIYPAAVWGIGQVFFRWQANGSLLDKNGNRTNGGPEDAPAVGSALIGQVFTAPGYFHPRPSAANNSTGVSFSSTGGYDPTSSGGTNYGPLNDQLLNGATTQPAAPGTPAGATTAPASQPAEVLAYDGVRLRTIHYASDNSITFALWRVAADGTKTPVDPKKYQNADGSWNDTALVDAFPHNGATAGLVAGDFQTPIPADAVTASASGLDPHISPANAGLQAARVAAARNISPDAVKGLISQYTDGPDLGFLGDPGVNVLRLNLALDARYPLPATPATQPATQPAK